MREGALSASSTPGPRVVRYWLDHDAAAPLLAAVIARRGGTVEDPRFGARRVLVPIHVASTAGLQHHVSHGCAGLVAMILASLASTFGAGALRFAPVLELAAMRVPTGVAARIVLYVEAR